MPLAASPILSVEEYLSSFPSTATNNPTLEPQIVSQVISTNHVAALNNLCQKLALTCEFDVERLEQFQATFSCTVTLSGGLGEGVQDQKFTEPGPFANKRGAREACARIALRWLNERVQRGVNMGRQGKKGSSGGLSTVPPEDEQLMAELSKGNWKARLNEYFQQHRAGPPPYTIFTIPAASGADCSPKFSCELALPESITISLTTAIVAKGSIANIPPIFGSRTNSVRTKKLAMALCAREVMQFLLASDPRLPPSAQGSSAPGSIKIAQPHLAAKAAPPSNGPRRVLIPPGVTAAAALMNTLCVPLGLRTPQYVFTPSGSLPPPYVDVLARIDTLKGDKTTEIGPVLGVLGKKKAREEVAELVLCWMLSQECHKQQVVLEGLPEEWVEIVERGRLMQKQKEERMDWVEEDEEEVVIKMEDGVLS